MKREIKGFLVGVLVTIILLGTVAFSQARSQTIEVFFNYVNLQVNGKKVDADNILYNGTTYVPLRAIAEMLGKEVSWDQVTRTASINDKATVTARVTRVVDGDTLEVQIDGKKERVRLIGIDTPESVHPDASKNIEAGKIALEFTRSKLEGKEVELEFDVQERDQYGRLLAYIYLDGLMFNKTLLEMGYARLATYPPNVKYLDDFTKIQEEARKNNKGFWSEDFFKEEVENEASERKTTGKYIGSMDSDKFHYPDCRWAEKILKENEIWFDTVEEAKEKGYQPCGVCKP